MNSFGRLFRVELFGESHGPALGCVIDGCPPGIPLAPEDFEADLARRRPGAPGTTPRTETDRPEILSGTYESKTSGSPICVLFRNEDVRSEDYGLFARIPRPGHADYVGAAKYRGFNDPRGSGHFSGRLTLPLVAAGCVAKKLLPRVRFATRLVEAGGRNDIGAAVAEAMETGDSVGGLVELRVDGLGIGLGEPFFDSAEGMIAHALFAVPGVRGVEFGDGFAAARMRGSEHNDRFVGAYGLTATNHSGGVNGGITNGAEMVLRVAVKPTATIATPQSTIDVVSGEMAELSAPGRHDACIAIRAAVALEAACAIALADLALIALAQLPQETNE
jgi:chorismate synthase